MDFDAGEARKIALNGASFLDSIVKENGKFIYKYDLNKNEAPGYNIVRHAGCLWALSIVNGITYSKEIKKGLDWMLFNNSVVIRDSESMGIEEGGYIKLGAVGLASLAISEYLRKNPDDEECKLYRKVIKMLHGYIIQDCFDSRTGSLFYHKRHTKEGIDSGFVSSFYPGEATLAIINTHQKSQQETLYSVEKIMRYYYKLSKVKGSIRDHWMLQAIACLPHLPKWVFEYAESIAIEETKRWPAKKAGPTACRVEALLAFLSLYSKFNLEKDNFYKDLYAVLQTFLRFMARLQCTEVFKGAFRESLDNPTVRCDITQHNICAFYKYAVLKESAKL